MREPNFENFLKVMRCEAPDRPTLFELFLNGPLYERLAGDDLPGPDETHNHVRRVVRAVRNAGYDHATTGGIPMRFPAGAREHVGKSISQNEGFVITDRASFEAYEWPDPTGMEAPHLEELADELGDGMKFVITGPGGVFENAVGLVGYQNLCLMTLEDPELTDDLFEAIGSRLVKYYEIAGQYDTVGAMIGNDDWGFRSQTAFPPEAMRRYVFKWHKKIVAAMHAAGRPAILHSCGNLAEVMDDVIDDIGYDAKHSFEDGIQPIEEAYEQYTGRIALFGGIDVDFLCRASLDEIKARSRAMVERSADRGGYCLGSGNSIPEYIPQEAYLAMISVAQED